MKVSVSLPDDDVAFLDDLARKQGYESRSAVLQKAVRLLRSADLEAAYADAWQEWDSTGERQAWEAVDNETSGRT